MCQRLERDGTNSRKLQKNRQTLEQTIRYQRQYIPVEIVPMVGQLLYWDPVVTLKLGNMAKRAQSRGLGGESSVPFSVEMWTNACSSQVSHLGQADECFYPSLPSWADVFMKFFPGGSVIQEQLHFEEACPSLDASLHKAHSRCSPKNSNTTLLLLWPR